MAAVAIRGTTYPVVLPKLRDPRLHLAATITSLQVLGQVAFHFKLSIAQILISLATVAVLEVTITFFKQRVLMWPASALLTGNGVAFVLRVPGTRHGDWWSTHGWWIYVATAGGSLLSKYVIAWKGEHVFNPSNIGLVVVFLALGRTRVEPLDFWWGPMSWWMALALIIIVSGGFAILSRLKLLRVALSFWAAFAVGIGLLALGGHAMTARWHLGPIEGFSFWWILVTSPEVLVFLFFMITDPKTAPRDPRARVAYGLTLGLLAAALIAPTTTEFAAKVALLSSLAIVCLVKALPIRWNQRVVVYVATAGAVAFTAVVAFANSGITHVGPIALPSGRLPAIKIDASPGVQTQLDLKTAEQIAYGVIKVRPANRGDVLHVHLVPGTDQSPPTAVAQLASVTYHLSQDANGAWAVIGAPPQAKPQPALASSSLRGTRLSNIAASAGVDFTQGSFNSGVTNDVTAMMGGGVCWLDYNGDGRLDLFAVNSYAGADTVHPTSRLFENTGRSFRDVTKQTNAGLVAQGDGCAAGDLDGDGRTDLVVTTTTGVDILWNHGGTFTTQALPATGWHTGVAIADVNGDGRPDIFAAGYADPNQPVPGSYAGFPTNLAGVRDLLFLNLGGHRFREVGVQAGLESSSFRHGLGAEFLDVNGDGRPDLYVANDEDPNYLYVNVPWPGGAEADPYHLGFRFEERAAAEGVADPFAGMGIAWNGSRLLVTNSRGEPSAVYRRAGATFANSRPSVDDALGTGFAGWGASWVDLANTGKPDLVLAAGAIPVTNLSADAEPMRVLAPRPGGYGNAAGVLPKLSLNGRGLAAADAFNDGREVIAVNTIGGKLVLLQPSGPSGNWLDVGLSRFVPGAVVTADGASRELQAGSSYLSSEDPRAHFGLGPRRVVRTLVVRYPWGARTVLHDVRADRVVTVPVPDRTARPAQSPVNGSTDCGKSAARWWDTEAADVFSKDGSAAPVQARNLYLMSLAAARAFAAEHTNAARNTAISYASYRLLVWLASFGANLGQSFAEAGHAFDLSCAGPAHTAAAAVGTRIADALIAASLHDGSNEALHYADPTFPPQNQPLVVGQAGSTVHDATFWQPLALAQVSPRGSSPVPAKVQTFVGAQWGSVRTFAGKQHVGAPALGDPSGKAYRNAALAVISQTAAPGAPARSLTPAAWNLVVLPERGLAYDVRLDLALNGALNDAAVSVYGAKRTYDAPRPISMIRYLAFNNQLPIVPGLTRRIGNVTQVRLDGRWVRGDRWTPRTPTPASPGWPSDDAAFADAADTVLSRLVGYSFRTVSATAAQAGVDNGTELAMDVAAGEKIGVAAGRAALAR